MKDIVKVGDREIELAANAASPFIYGKIFKDEDFEKDVESVGAWRKMAFVMAKQAQIDEKILYKNPPSEEDFIEWLRQFDPMEFNDILEKATTLYSKQQKAKSNPKRKAE